ncbi:hypothetical protein [Amaricoccus solimangrovi]|uniref:Uncharacterized protein n=1 Tax=Amaricoccus solimangrovi TaxID=2589815 RepID=A0A501WV38_9RHOB|nr:hypothetical protein [Amaricoccus solimangrovi]TPE52612.1 hypothetical protein FJM51_05385 [Amaricoccus solimangrovi]
MPAPGQPARRRAVTLADLIEAREIVAIVIAEDGAAALPILERIEAEIARAEAEARAIERARLIATGGRFRAASRAAA